MKHRGVLRTISFLAASMMAAASLLVTPVVAADSEAEEVLGRLSGSASVSQTPASTNVAQQDEVNAIWIAFLDLQKILPGKSESTFRASVQQMYQNCVSAALNTVIVQVRPYGDSFYPSDLFPWSSYASGKLGTSPGFDPLEILVEEAHKKGLTFEAWVNPLRLMAESEISSVSTSYPVRQWYDNPTKKALEASLKKLMLQKPLDKITIRDITDDCGISRMTFYYHFQDIYDLVEWVCIEDATAALQGKKTCDTWQEGLSQIFEAVLEQKPFVLNACRCISREQMENFLFKMTYGLIRGVVDEKSAGAPITEEQKAFIADFYKYSFVGLMLDWIKRGMHADYHDLVRNISLTVQGSVDNAIRNFSQA